MNADALERVRRRLVDTGAPPGDDGISSSEIGLAPERAATCTTDGDTRSKISIAPRSASENAPR